MKTLQSFLLIAVFSFISFGADAQNNKTETFDVSGNCGMCKKKIETAAKQAGADSANWNKETGKITVKYTSSQTNLKKIQEKIADAGYDNAGVKATETAYNKLEECCQYDRKISSNNPKDDDTDK